MSHSRVLGGVRAQCPTRAPGYTRLTLSSLGCLTAGSTTSMALTATGAT